MAGEGILAERLASYLPSQCLLSMHWAIGTGFLVGLGYQQEG